MRKEQRVTTGRTLDMTSGAILPMILAFAVPMFIGNVFQQVYNMVDTMVAGYRLGDSAIAAIGATSSLYTLIVGFAVGLNSGYAIVVTRYFGAKNHDQLRRAVGGMGLFNGVMSLVLVGVTLPFLEVLLRAMNVPQNIFNSTYSYIGIIIAGMPATVGYNMFAAVLRSFGNSRTALYFLILGCVVNIGLDLLFIILFNMGVAGAALATVLAQGLTAVLSGVYFVKKYPDFVPHRGDFVPNRAMAGDLLSNGFAMALMLSVIEVGSVVFQGAANLLCGTAIAAHTAARRIINILMQPIFTLATAHATFVAQNKGAGQYQRIRVGLRRVMAVEIGYALFTYLPAFLLGGWLVRFTTGTTSAQILSLAQMSIRIHTSMMPALAVLICLRNFMQPMGRRVAPVISSCIEMAMKFFSAAVLVPRLGFVGICITEPITWVLMAVFLVIAYFATRQSMFDPGEEALT